ncbi:hypothetical protein PUNSTDRAFT_134067 [Punctularia strigosozonata HHB-11173 SS5]|uniref:uncharacterized protein n=1 Tax=Punctularia strigosozonata (strain HHB-11173) TaxID=741275 RepID=UPI000441759C|nr:uncharacterized protein PUNSTDRAFT_134067 [Punctularia strigosozonata HHB-11173 SS5]EIN08893.1 hypothetical protein PUNSTDRAFT_134067 [Punctularia strigosozonata HHB-11173 SS5]
MNTVASLLSIRHQLTLSDGRDIEHALELRRQVLECSNPRSRHHSINLCNLASTLSLKFAWIGGLGNLEEAIQLGRQAADAAPSDLPQRYAIADDIANVLMLRFAETGEISDLNEALNWDRTAMAAISPSHARYSSIAVDMIAHLCTRFEHFHTSNDLEEAISLSEDILRSASANTRVHKPHGTYSLSKALLLRSQHNGNLHDVERAIQELEPVVSGFSERSAWPEFARTLARCFSARFRLIRHADDAHRALAIMNQLLMDVPPGYRERYQCLVDIAELYMQRDAPYYNLSLALENLMHALKDDSRDVRSRLQGAANMLDMIQTHHQEALKGDRGALSQLLDIYLQTISLLQRVAYFSVHLHSRLQSLKAAQNVALRGASIALVLCLPHKSLEILEQGRAIFWTHSLRLRSPFDVVPEDLRDRLSTLALQLDSAAHASHSVDDPRVLEATIAQRRRQTEDFNLLLKEIRGLPGLERFLMHDEFGTLTKAAERGPVVVLVSSTVACHAIIIKRPDDATSILIDRLPSAWLAESGIAWRSAMEDARADLGGRLKVAKPAKRHTPESAKGAEILRRLWVDAVKPILDVLGIRPSAGRNRPRVWWCPTGHFVHLPIHGAGADGIWCSDYVVSSYIPTLSSLRTTRANYERIPKRDIRALVASVRRSRMSQWTELPSTREEVSAVRRALPEEALIELPRVDDVSSGDGDGITAEALLKLLPQATILHLACHGHQDVDNPLQSGFVMQDEMLTIERLMPVPLPHAFMAFLSACETAKGDKASLEQPDQIVHLAATILFAGFKSVVATLWSMEDVDGPMIAQSVYQDIFCGDTDHINPDDVAYALDKAVQKLRLAHPEPSRWAPYIHLGM